MFMSILNAGRNSAFILSALTMSILLSKPVNAQPSVTLTPYVWAPAVRGTVSLGPVSRPLSMSPLTLLKGYKGGGFGRVSADWKKAFVYTEALSIRYGNTHFEPFFGQAVNGEATLAEVGAGLHRSIRIAHQSAVVVSPYIGARYVALKATVNGPLVFVSARNRGVDPLAGVMVEIPVGNNWKLAGKLVT